jgi:cellulose synthase/poly-beta-1,6-N-acetylglucosamine synthase-like glycosyltransferase
MDHFLIVLLIASGALYCFFILAFFAGLFRLKRPKSDAVPFISVVIAVHNEERSLAGCLENIAAQTYPVDKFEVIVADDRSTDSTPAIIAGFVGRYPHFKSVRVDESDNVVPKKFALAKALDIAAGEIIASTDGDCAISENWLRSMSAYFTPDVGFVIGHTNYRPVKRFWPGIDALDYLSQRALGAGFIGIGSVYTCTASNMAYRKDLYTDNRKEFLALKVRPAEDNFFLFCAKRKASYTIAVATDRDSIVETDGATGFFHFFNQRFRWAAYGGNYITVGMKLFFIPSFLFFVTMLLSAAVSPLYPSVIRPLGTMIAAKFVVDFLFTMKSCALFDRRSLPKYFLPLFLLH